MIKVKRIAKICDALPSQWEITSEDGVEYYANYEDEYLEAYRIAEVNECVYSMGGINKHDPTFMPTYVAVDYLSSVMDFTNAEVVPYQNSHWDDQ